MLPQTHPSVFLQDQERAPFPAPVTVLPQPNLGPSGPRVMEHFTPGDVATLGASPDNFIGTLGQVTAYPAVQ